MTAGQLEHPVADVLRVLAVSRSSGALEVRGLRSGTFFLHDGDITYAEALGVPPAEEFDAADPRLRSTIQSSIVEVGLNLLAAENSGGDRPLFRPGRRHWSGRAIRVGVEALLSEIAQQMVNFAELGVEPDDEVRLRGLPPGRMVVLTRRQWALAAELLGPQTARLLARRSGSSLRATIENLASLVTVGVVERRPPAPPPVAPIAPPDPAEPVSVPAHRESGLPEPPLPQRVRGATPLPPASPRALPPPDSSSPARPDSRSRTPPRREPDEAGDSGRALALRLLEGLRRL